ncbi:MAG: hypothetical protein K2Q21_02680 [Chitinophagaceae bacterium]|nr:hypothetical protein [Chitinophagaceae bacterium]
MPVKIRIVASYDDAYEFTAIPIIALIRQYMDGSIKAGLWMMGHIVDPKRLINDMQEMGIHIETQVI